jgi:hypothetical protein
MGLIIRLIIQTIRRDPTGSDQIDEAPNLSRADPSEADQTDAEHQSTDLVLLEAAPRAAPVQACSAADSASSSVVSLWNSSLSAPQGNRSRLAGPRFGVGSG